MTQLLTLRELDMAASLLRAGAVVAYPTEAVFGLGCNPLDDDALMRIYRLKQRSPGLGFLLIAAEEGQLAPFVDWSAMPDHAMRKVRSTWPGPHTWIVPRRPTTPSLLAGDQSGIGVRVTAHGPAARLCLSFGGALVSTSANLHGRSPAKAAQDVLSQFGEGDIDAIVDGPLGDLARPTQIRDAMTGEFVRS